MQTRRAHFKASIAFAAALCCTSVFAQKGETVKVAWIDPLTGLMATVGQNQLNVLGSARRTPVRAPRQVMFAARSCRAGRLVRREFLADRGQSVHCGTPT